MKIKLNKELKRKLVEWLKEEYTEEEAVKDIEEAEITIQTIRLISIKYTTNRIDHVYVGEDSNIIHLNPVI